MSNLPTITPPVPASGPEKKKSKWRYVLYFFGALALLRACAGLSPSDKAEALSQPGAPIASQRSSGEKPAGTIGQAYATRYFEVTVHAVERVDRIVTEDAIVNEHFVEQTVSPEVAFLIIDATYRNTDTESRTITAGDVNVRTPDGKSYKFDNAEMIPAKGWHLALETINPMMSFRTRLVYKIPSALRGDVTFVPHNRAERGQSILLGRL